MTAASFLTAGRLQRLKGRKHTGQEHFLANPLGFAYGGSQSESCHKSS
jgi:hypothetical protein